MSIDAERYFGVSDEIDGKSDGKNATRRTKFSMGQWLASAVEDRVGVRGLRGDGIFFCSVRDLTGSVDHCRHIVNSGVFRP